MADILIHKPSSEPEQQLTDLSSDNQFVLHDTSTNDGPSPDPGLEAQQFPGLLSIPPPIFVTAYVDA